MSRVTILGVPIDAFTQRQALDQLHAFIVSGKQHHVATPNNEMLVEAWKNPPFHAVLRQTSLNLADSTGLLWAARRTKQRLPQRVTGVDTVAALCRELTADQSVFFLGAAPGVAEKAAQQVSRLNNKLRIAGTYAGSPKPQEAASIIKKINDSGASVLFVAFGAPKQDMWIAEHMHLLPRVRLAMGVGGTFDFLAGVQKRAPSFMRSLGLEWLWRLILQPQRLPRIARATLLFPLLVLQYGRAGPR